MRYLDPKNYLVLWIVFGRHPHLLRSFLNALLPLEEGQEIESLEYLPAELVPAVPLFTRNSDLVAANIEVVGAKLEVES